MIRAGVDLIQVHRVRDLLRSQGSKFVQRVLTEKEIKECFGGLELESAAQADTETPPYRRSLQLLAGNFALKEAFAKAVGTGIGSQLSFQDIEIVRNEWGKPEVHYLGEKIELMKQAKSMDASISHDGDFLVAFIVIDF